MFKIALVMTVLVAYAAAAPLGFGLGAPLLGKVSYEPAEYKTIQPEVTVQQPEYRYKSVPVPVPVAAPYYTAPAVVSHPYVAATPVAYHYAAAPAAVVV